MCTFLCCCLPCGSDETSEASDTIRTPTPILQQTSSSSSSSSSSTSTASQTAAMMRGPLTRTYGRKKTAGTPAAAAVFGRARESSPLLQGQQSSPLSSQSRQASLRDPLVDITSVVENLSIAGPSELADAGELATVVVENLSIADNASAAEVSELANVSETTQNELESIGNDESGVTDPGPTDTADISQDLEPLRELFDAYRQDCGEPLHMRRWDEVIGGELSISKIAEASFAEVYRVTTEYGSSILKIMQLKLASDPASLKSYTTVDVRSIVSEMRIMNAMTEIPGFVSFKDAHLVRGKPGTILSDAWSGYLDRSRDSDPDAPMRLTYFPKPDSYSDESVFLVIELGDAGQVLQKAHIDARDKLFDIFLGITVILSRAEQEAEFEHRDLHENNICISRHDPPQNQHDLPESVLFGRSGLEVTLIDYGLSRAKLPNGDIAYCDLEEDLAVFCGEDGNSQYDTYRRMRCHLFTGRRGMLKSYWHNEDSREKNNGHTWAEYIPYTNVLWLKYIFGWLRHQYLKGLCLEDQSDLWFNIPGMSDLNKRFDLRTKKGFDSATEVLVFAVDHGWITNEQIEESGFDTTVLSEESIVAE